MDIFFVKTRGKRIRTRGRLLNLCNKADEYLRGYPGDEYVDMLSLDWYGQGAQFNRDVRAALEFTTALAQQKG